MAGMHCWCNDFQLVTYIAPGIRYKVDEFYSLITSSLSFQHPAFWEIKKPAYVEELIRIE